MRLRAGRPDLSRYAEMVDVPAATTPFSVTFLGVSTLLVSDGDPAILTDGYFSRPGLLKVGLGTIAPDRARIRECLSRAGVRALEAVLPVHSHFDHALDSGVVAAETGALLIGGESTANVGRGAGLADERILQATPGGTTERGPWAITLIESEHCPPDRYPGTITTPVVPPARASAYRCGEAWSILVAHRNGRSLLVQGSAGFVPGALSGRSADVVFLGVGQLGLQDEDYITTYWIETVRAVGARRAVLTHWDDFFRPLPGIGGAGPLRALPYASDDLDVTIRVLRRLAEADGVALSLPEAWRREDPWVGLNHPHAHS